MDTTRLHPTRRSRVERAPDYGNVAYVDCRKCGTPNVLDPGRLEDTIVAVFLFGLSRAPASLSMPTMMEEKAVAATPAE